MAELAKDAKGNLRILDASHIKLHQDASNPAGPTKSGNWACQGRAVSFKLAAGQQPDVCVAEQASQPELQGTITVADKGYDSDGFRAQLRQSGSS